MGVPESKYWERPCHNHSLKVTILITPVINNVIDIALRKDISTAIRLKLNYLSEDEININNIVLRKRHK